MSPPASAPTMPIFRSQGPPFVPPRDDMTLPAAQFILDDAGAERTRPAWPAHVPCLIDSDTGKAVYLEQLRTRSHAALARSLKARRNFLGVGTVVSSFSVYSQSHWRHRLGNPQARR
ncbi:hypothetical protein LXA43DRAFT_104905 [Ganoderma leucocontextum]|nr:hypothetical protein LXA43DRAFT_104905 [Ganoderma leucocontextum]